MKSLVGMVLTKIDDLIFYETPSSEKQNLKTGGMSSDPELIQV